jgi:nucleoid-associated protein YgaU
LFDKDGTPLRAKVDCTFTQYDDVNDYDRQNPTSGGGPVQRVHAIIRGDRLDTIAAEFYQDATKWRAIAEYNNITDPLALHPGQRIVIPEL